MPIDLWLDLRQSLRLLAKDRAFTLSAAASPSAARSRKASGRTSALPKPAKGSPPSVAPSCDTPETTLPHTPGTAITATIRAGRGTLARVRAACGTARFFVQTMGPPHLWVRVDGHDATLTLF